MKRKLIRQGLGGATITLPVKWIKANNLKPGDEVDVEEKNLNLMISSTTVETSNFITIDIENVNIKYVRSILASLYKAGYDEITLNFKAAPNLNQINKIINTFTGLEIVAQNKNSFTIKSFLKIEKDQVENLIIKMMQILKLLADTIKEDWNDVNHKDIRLTVKETIQKLRDHCLRTIHSLTYGGDKSYDYYDLVTILEKIATEFSYMAELISNVKLKESKLFDDLLKLLEESYKCYLKKDFASANNLWDRLGDLMKKTKKDSLSVILKKENPEFVVMYYHTLKLFQHLSSRLISLSS